MLCLTICIAIEKGANLKRMKVRKKSRFIGESDLMGCIYGKVYEIVTYNEEYDMYGVLDETGMYDDVASLYYLDEFEIID